MTNVLKVDVEGIGKAFNWGWKIGVVLIPTLYTIFSFYSAGAAMQQHDTQLEARMVKIETNQNEQDGANVEKFATLGAAVEVLQKELDFYKATIQPKTN